MIFFYYAVLPLTVLHAQKQASKAVGSANNLVGGVEITRSGFALQNRTWVFHFCVLSGWVGGSGYPILSEYSSSKIAD
jgi:hypothetical protein